MKQLANTGSELAKRKREDKKNGCCTGNDQILGNIWFPKKAQEMYEYGEARERNEETN